MEEAKKWKVRDTGAKLGETRMHEIIIKTFDDGREPATTVYKLGSEAHVEMPEEHARKFLHDPGFEVLDNDGALVKPVKKRDLAALFQHLQEGETVAEYDELTHDSLLKRASVLPGSESFRKNTPKAELIEFILSATRREIGVSRGSEGVAPEMDAGSLERLMPKSSLVEQVNRKAA